MSNYDSDVCTDNPTYSQFLIPIMIATGGLHAAAFLNADDAWLAALAQETNFNRPLVESNGTQGNQVLFAESKIDQKLNVTLADAYEKLLTSQETHGADFDKALHENLWDLYES